MTITEDQYARIAALRKRLASAIRNADYEGKDRDFVEGSLEISCEFPGIYDDPTGENEPRGWEIEVICRYGGNYKMNWWETTLDAVLTNCERILYPMFDEMEGRSANSQA